jgi:hypothetical protein
MIQHIDISELAALPENWDGYGAVRIKQPALDVLATMKAIPSTDGGLLIEWTRNGWDVTIGIGPDGTPTCFLSERSAVTCRPAP